MRSRTPGIQWEGYIVDLVKKMGEIVPFEFEWLIKNSLGRRHRSGQWNGMIGELLQQVRYLLNVATVRLMTSYALRC